jgi:hypothetical protein
VCEYYFKNTERSQINGLRLHLKHLKNKNKLNPKPGKREITKTRAKINKIEIKKTIQKSI